MARALASGLAALIVAGFIGQVFRDRTIALALLMYLPLPLLGLAALVLELLYKGRSIPRFRFGLLGMGLAAIAWSCGSMVGIGTPDEPRPGDVEISVMQWNVLWGGGPFRSLRTWASQRGAISMRRPDLIVLSEAPPDDWLDRLADDLGPGASCVASRHPAASPYWYHLAVVSRWPLHLEDRRTFPGGAGMIVRAEVAGRPLRLLVVDGISTPTRSRLPFLRAIAETCRLAEDEKKPIDLILGDFNTPSRSLGFVGLEELGYRLASRSSRGWRGTFPAWLPAYDIDHVWLRSTSRMASCTLFHGPYSDHRGQVVRVLSAEEPRE